MANVFFDKGVKGLLLGTIIMDGSTHVIKAACLDENAVTPVDTMEFFSEFSAGIVGTPVDISSNLSLDATSGEIRCASFQTGVLSGNTVESILIYRDTGNDSTSPVLCTASVSITPNGAANFTISFAGNKLVGISAAGFFHKTFGKLASGATTLNAATVNAQLVTAAPAFTEEFMAEISNTTGTAVDVGSFSVLDAGAAFLPSAPTTFTSITATVTHAVLFIDTGDSATDLPIGAVSISPAITLSAADFELGYPGTGALQFASA